MPRKESKMPRNMPRRLQHVADMLRTAERAQAAASLPAALDAIIVGAGFSGMYMLKKLRELGLRCKVLERGADVGGTWYWNRYPGARCDVPSMEYSYSFDEDLQQEWSWTEVMAGQPEILSYASHVADRFDLRADMQFNTSVMSAHYDEAAGLWRVTTDAGDTLSAQWCIMAVGCLSKPNTPDIPGASDFGGPVYHTGQWPHEGVDFTGVRVGLIGTGSSGIQCIPEVAKEAESLTIFQRTPNYTMPAGNAPLSDEFVADAKAHYTDIRATQRDSAAGIVGYGFGFGGNDMRMPTENILDTTPEQRAAKLEAQGWGAVRDWVDIAVDPEANEVACEMYLPPSFCTYRARA
eukprot:COSAG02_NODE_16098_length_1113_cov_1.407298_1_plen_349_part_10